MHAETLRPHPSLLPWISHFFAIEQEGSGTGFVLPLIANGFPSLIFHTSDRAWIPEENRCLQDLSLNGQYVAPIHVAFRGRFALIACFSGPTCSGPCSASFYSRRTREGILRTRRIPPWAES